SAPRREIASRSSVISAPKGIPNADKDAARFVVELGDGLARHAAGEVEMAEGALDAAIHRHRDLGRYRVGQAGDTLPARPDALAIIDCRRRGLGGGTEIVAKLDLVQ